MGANGVLLVSCLDQRGIVAAVTAFVAEHGGNIVDLQQHTDSTEQMLFQRVEFELDGFDLDRSAIAGAFAPITSRFGMDSEVRFTDHVPAVALLASREPHCLQDLLSRCRNRELRIDVRGVVSNHPDHRDLVAWFGVPFHHLPVTPATKADDEGRLVEVLQEAGVELVVLARYMQVLSADVVARWPDGIINIHHSFLPAFSGARPYHQAHDRGVKLIGVTAHYVTAELDEGPIIDQDVVRVSHRDDVEALRRKGRELEVQVLARALAAHVEHRVLRLRRRTVVFD